MAPGCVWNQRALILRVSTNKSRPTRLIAATTTEAAQAPGMRGERSRTKRGPLRDRSPKRSETESNFSYRMLASAPVGFGDSQAARYLR